MKSEGKQIHIPTPQTDIHTTSATPTTTANKCFNCGHNKHPWYKCPAKDATCNSCESVGHYAKVCWSKPPQSKDTTLNKGSTAALPNL